MAQTLMARLPQKFPICSSIPRKNPIAADIIVFGIIWGDFLFYVDNVHIKENRKDILIMPPYLVL